MIFDPTFSAFFCAAIICSDISIYDTPNTGPIYTRELNEKHYELTDHLGNFRVVLGDRKQAQTPGQGPYTANMEAYTHQYPFGMPQPGRTWDGDETNYRYGFNGMETDPEVKGERGNHYTTYFRQYDPRVGRWWSNDPITHPWQSPYSAMNGNPIYFSDASGAHGDPTGASGSEPPRTDEEGFNMRGLIFGGSGGSTESGSSSSSSTPPTTHVSNWNPARYSVGTQMAAAAVAESSRGSTSADFSGASATATAGIVQENEPTVTSWELNGPAKFRRETYRDMQSDNLVTAATAGTSWIVYHILDQAHVFFSYPINKYVYGIPYGSHMHNDGDWVKRGDDIIIAGGEFAAWFLPVPKSAGFTDDIVRGFDDLAAGIDDLVTLEDDFAHLYDNSITTNRPANALEPKDFRAKADEIKWLSIENRGGETVFEWFNMARLRPERKYLGSKKHGINWTEGAATAKSLRKPQGQWGSIEDLNFAGDMAATLSARKAAYFELPSSHSSVVHNIDGTTSRATHIWIRNNGNGTFHGYPLIK